MLEPTIVELPKPTEPTGNILVRTLRALLVERRLPTKLQDRADRVLTKVGLGVKTIRVGDFRFAIRRTMTDRHYVHDVIEQGEYDAPGYAIEPGQTVVDIGANIGAFAILAAKRVQGGRVVAVEPMADNIAMLNRNLELNRLTNVSVVQGAVVGEPTATVAMHRSTENSGAHSVKLSAANTSSDADLSSELVPAMTLTELFTQQQVTTCHLLKLDCEGAEYTILEHADPATFARIERIVMEYHADSIASKALDANRLISKLQTLGFVIDSYLDYHNTLLGIIRARRK